MTSPSASPPGHGVPYRDALRVWLRVAALSFGGPAAQISVMHRLIVDERRWISDARFLHALSYCTLLPGPEAQQLATYIGWLMHRTLGGLTAGILFVLPGVVSLMALSMIYAAYGHVGVVAAAFFGLKAAVLSIVVDAVFKLGQRALRSHATRAIAAFAFIGIFFFAAPFPLIILVAALVGWIGARAGWRAFAPAGGGGPAAGDDGSLLGETTPEHARPSLARTLRAALLWGAVWLAPVALIVGLRGADDIFGRMAIYFSEMAVVTFGGAYAALAYVAQQAVAGFHWLTPGEMLDGLGMAETTPGPLIMVLQFVGFIGAYRARSGLPPMLAGALGGLIATWMTFAPCFLWIFLGGPFIERLRGDANLAGALRAITAAVGGVILNLAVWFAIHAIFRATIPVHTGGLSFDAPDLRSVDVAALALALLAALAMFRFKAGMLPTLALSCAAGVGLYLAGLA